MTDILSALSAHVTEQEHGRLTGFVRLLTMKRLRVLVLFAPSSLPPSFGWMSGTSATLSESSGGTLWTSS